MRLQWGRASACPEFQNQKLRGDPYPGSENNLPPPRPFIFFYIGDHFFIKGRGALVRIVSRKNLGGAGAEPPGKVLQYQVQKQKVLRI